MKLTYFSIQDFRSIAKAKFEELATVAILIGPNNEGKSNVLRALHSCLTLLADEDMSLRPSTTLGGSKVIRVRYDRDTYDWAADFPVGKQAKSPDGDSVFELHFELTEDEQATFLGQTNSKLNGVLPIQLSFGPSPYASFKVLKQGRGGSALSRKALAICRFISTSLDFVYVPAIRTAETSEDLVTDLVTRELRLLERNPKYVESLNDLLELQQPVLDSIVGRLRASLREFLGASFKDVRLDISSRNRFRPMVRGAQIVIDDGTPTPLERKGDGVKSLVAISLMTRALQQAEAARNVILLIEKPESHLHPKAIHQLREVLKSLRQDRQIIVTTHCPLLVNRTDVPANIIVSRSKASPATSLEQLRGVLGVRASDNLRHAGLVIVVEGREDQIALEALLKATSPKIAKAIGSGGIAFEVIRGASKLSFALSSLQAALCNYYCILDDDEEGRRAYGEAKRRSLGKPREHIVCKAFWS